MARDALGKLLVHDHPEARLVARVVETEAYHMQGDPACHAARGKTARNAVMFGPPGYLYVYFIYGIHYCMNLVAEEEGIAAAVLIRALEPLAGADSMLRLRGGRCSERDLLRGPGRACQGMGIGNPQNGARLSGTSGLFLASDGFEARRIVTTTRIGISRAQELPWRFFLADSPYVSRPATNS